MKRFAFLAILLAAPVLAQQQNNSIPPGTPTNPVAPEHGQQAVPITPPPSTQVYNGGYGWGGGGQTPQGAALQGMSQVISAAGQANLANSAAAINYTQAQSNDLRNQIQGTQTFWAMRDIGRAEREKERGPRPTPEELARRARAGAARAEHESNRSRVRKVVLAQRLAAAGFRRPARSGR